MFPGLDLYLAQVLRKYFSQSGRFGCINGDLLHCVCLHGSKGVVNIAYLAPGTSYLVYVGQAKLPVGRYFGRY